MSERTRFAIGGVTFDATSGELGARAVTCRLEPKAAAVLAILCTRSGELVTRRELLDRCWGNGEGSDEALTQAVSQIRRAMQDLGEPTGLIETLAKRGYRISDRDAATDVARTPGAGKRKYSAPTLLAAGVLFALVLGAIVFPHELRHTVRHGLGLGPPSAGAPAH